MKKIKVELTETESKMVMEAVKSFYECDKDMPESAPPNAVKHWRSIIKKLREARK